MVISASISVSVSVWLSPVVSSVPLPKEQPRRPTATQIRKMIIPIPISKILARSGPWFLLLARLLALVEVAVLLAEELRPEDVLVFLEASSRSELSFLLLCRDWLLLLAAVCLPLPLLLLYDSLIPIHPYFSLNTRHLLILGVLRPSSCVRTVNSIA